jgi:hypothetical protein
MKRLALFLVAVALLAPAGANAQLTMQMSNGWSFSFAGNVNAFWVYSKVNNNGPANSSVRTGLLPAFATFEARGKEGGMNLSIHFGFAPEIQNAGVHDQFGAQIDMRQVYMTVGGDWGSLLAGRELSVFGRQNILNDQTLFGVGAVGVGAGQAGGTTLGRIGYGYIYPNFNAQVTYTTKGGQPAQLSIGAFQPSTVAGVGGYTITKIPRLEAELTYNKKSGTNKYMFWAGGLWQSTSNAPTGGTSISSVGGTAGVRGDFAALSVVVNGYIGKGVGTEFMFSPTAGGGVAANGTDLRSSDGGYVQVGYTMNKKTTIAGSWGFSRLKNNQTGDGNTAVRTQWTSVTGGIYHQWTKSLKVVGEVTHEQVGIGSGAPGQIDVSGGLMLFF